MTGVILASGYAKRMGMQKLLLNVDGMPMIERVLKTVKASDIKEVILVYHDERIKAIGDQYNVKTVYNPTPQDEQSASIRLGVAEADPDTEGFMFFVGNQPFLQVEVINALLTSVKKEKKCIVVPLYDGLKGNPVTFHSKYRNELLSVSGNEGIKEFIGGHIKDVSHINFINPIFQKGMDTWEAYEEFRV